MCWGEGTLEAYVRGVDLDRLGLEKDFDAPFVPVVSGRYQSCVSVDLGTPSTTESSSARTRGAWTSTRGCGARHATRTRVPSSAGRRVAVGTWRRVGRAPCRWRCDRSTIRGGDDAGAHARHMRRRTSGLCQLTFPPRPISRLSSASLPSLAAAYTAMPIEWLIASAVLYRPSSARTPADWEGHAAPL
jgi:hypothetical protein